MLLRAPACPARHLRAWPQADARAPRSLPPRVRQTVQTLCLTFCFHALNFGAEAALLARDMPDPPTTSIGRTMRAFARTLPADGALRVTYSVTPFTSAQGIALTLLFLRLCWCAARRVAGHRRAPPISADLARNCSPPIAAPACRYESRWRELCDKWCEVWSPHFAYLSVFAHCGDRRPFYRPRNPWPMTDCARRACCIRATYRKCTPPPPRPPTNLSTRAVTLPLGLADLFLLKDWPLLVAARPAPANVAAAGFTYGLVYVSAIAVIYKRWNISVYPFCADLQARDRPEMARRSTAYRTGDRQEISARNAPRACRRRRRVHTRSAGPSSRSRLLCPPLCPCTSSPAS